MLAPILAFGGSPLDIGIIGVFGLLPMVLFLYALVDLLKRQAMAVGPKVVWLLVILLAPVIGPILYLLMGRNQA